MSHKYFIHNTKANALQKDEREPIQNAESLVVSSNMVQQEKEQQQQQLQEQFQQQHLEFNPYFKQSAVDSIDEEEIIYKEYLYDKFLLSPLEKYQKYGKWPMKMVVHIFLILLTTSQILYSSNTLSTNSTEQYEQWRQLFFQEPSNQNIKNYDFENKMIFYTTVDKFQNQLITMFEELNKNNTLRIQDVYFNYSSIELKVFYNYPMDSSLIDYPSNHDGEDDGHEDGDSESYINGSSELLRKIKDSLQSGSEQDYFIRMNEGEQKRRSTLPVNKTKQTLKKRDFYQELSFNMNRDISRLLNKNKLKNKQKKRIFSSTSGTYNQAQLVFPVDRKVGILKPFNMNNVTQIKQILQYTQRLQIQLDKVILIKSNLVSCWEFTLDYDLYEFATIRALLQADGGVCSNDLFEKGIELHVQEYNDTYAFPNPMANKRSNQKTKLNYNFQERQNQNKDEQDLKKQKLKVRGTRYNSPKSSKKSSISKNRKLESFDQQFQQEGQFKQNVINSNNHHYEKNGNLYKSGNLLFIGFNTLIDVLSLICSSLSLILSLKYLVQIIEVYIQTFEKSTKVYFEKENKHKLKLQKHKSKYLTLQRILAEQRPWQELDLWEKLSYFDLWFFMILIGNFFQMVGSFYLLFLDSRSELDQRTSVIDWTVGIGCFCSWCSLMKYFEYSKSLAIILDVLKFALPELIKVLIEFSLLYISFIIVGMTSFWQSERFSDVRSTSTTLFGLVMADSIYDVIQDCEENGVLPNFMAQIYVMLFVLMFIICVTNIMIGILEDGYTRNKREIRFQKTIQNVSNEKERAVLSKMVKKKENLKQNQFQRRQSFDSDDGINYGKKQYATSPQVHALSPRFNSNNINSNNVNNSNGNGNSSNVNNSSNNNNNSNTNNNNNNMMISSNRSLRSPMFASSFTPKQDRSKTSPLMSMKMVTNAGIAIQKAKKFVQIRKKQEEPKIKFPNIDIDGGSGNDVSLFDETNQPIFQVEEQSQQSSEQGKSSAPSEQKIILQDRESQFARLKHHKSKTLQNLNKIIIDEKPLESEEEENKQQQVSFKQIESEVVDEANSLIQRNDKYKEAPKRITFGDDFDMFGRQSEKFSEILQIASQPTPAEIFRKELENLKNKEIFVERTKVIFNNCYKRLKFQLEESQKLLINLKFFQINRRQKGVLYKKYAQYLMYFQQRVAALLMEIQHFGMD